MPALNGLDQLQDIPTVHSLGEIRLIPDQDTLRVLPYAPNTAAMVADLYRNDGRPHEVSSRHFLGRMTKQLAERHLTITCSIETEFVLAHCFNTHFEPIDKSLDLSTIGMGAAAHVIDKIIASLEAQQVQVELYYPEVGHGQHELSVAPRSAVHAADDQIRVRETIRAVASNCGLVASLSPKAWPDQPGNGAHLHISLWDEERKRNLFHDPSSRFGLSSTAEHFLAGVLAHLPALLSITAPSFLSYRRLAPNQWSSAFTSWGFDNREASIRIPPTSPGCEEETTHLEYRPMDGSCNPHLAIAAIIVAGLDGMDRRLQPPEPISTNPASADRSDWARHGIRRYPRNMASAAEALESDRAILARMGPVLTDAHFGVRRSEWTAVSSMDEESIFRSHFERY